MTLPPNELIAAGEIDALRRCYGDFAVEHHRVEMQPESLKTYQSQLARRRGEILLALARPEGELLLHTKHFYPAGIYRLLTGGIDPTEPVVDAWHRELREETQLDGVGERLLGVLSYEFCHGAVSVPFVSYVFHLGGIAGTPTPLDQGEGISGFRWASRLELAEVAAALRSLDRVDQARGDWGRFRAVAHDFLHAAAW